MENQPGVVTNPSPLGGTPSLVFNNAYNEKNMFPMDIITQLNALLTSYQTEKMKTTLLI